MKVRIRNSHEQYLGDFDFATGEPSWSQAGRRGAKYFDDVDARKIVSSLAARGISAYCFSGGSMVDLSAEDSREVVEPAPATHRGQTPVRIRAGLWQLTFRVGPNMYSLQGKSPADIFSKMYDPDYQAASEPLRKFVESLPPEEPVAPVVVATPPAQNLNPNGYVLRPGTLRDEPQQLPERRIDLSATSPNAEYEAYLNNPNVPAKQFGERLKSDEAFRNYVNSRRN